MTNRNPCTRQHSLQQEYLRDEKLPAAFLRVFNWGKLAPLLKAPSLLKGQYLECEGMTGFGRSRNDYAHISGGSVTNLIVWATSPVAPQMLQTNLRRTGQVTIFPSRVFKLWELKQKCLLLHFKVASNLVKQFTEAIYLTCKNPQALHWGSTSCSASLPFRSCL